MCRGLPMIMIKKTVFALGLIVALGAMPAFAAQAEKDSAEIQYLDMDPLVLPVVDARGISQSIHISISLELADGTDKETLKRYQPRLADAYLNEMYGTLGEGFGLTPTGVLDIPYLKERLTAITTEVLGDGLVTNVLIQAVHQQPL